jgi:hypothetical protein
MMFVQRSKADIRNDYQVGKASEDVNSAGAVALLNESFALITLFHFTTHVSECWVVVMN